MEIRAGDMGTGIGIDIGGTKMLGLVLGSNEAVNKEILVKTAASQGYETLIARLKQLIYRLLEASEEEVSTIGIALAGAAEEGSRVVYCPNLPLREAELARMIEEEFHLPCLLSNDVNAALYAESCFNRAEAGLSELGLFVGTGVGGAIVIDGKLYMGRGGAGEFGHMRIEAEGRLCGCGNKGCLEAYASKTAMQHYIREQLKKGRASLLAQGFESEEEGGMLRKGALLKAFREGDDIALEALDMSRRALGLALVNLVNIFHPSTLVLGGGIMEDFYDYYEPYLRAYIERESYRGFSDNLIIRKARLGDRGAALGAALLAAGSRSHN